MDQADINTDLQRCEGSNQRDLAQLIADARGGSQDALGALLEACRGYLLAIANRELDSDLGGKVGASDLVQDTLLEAGYDIERFRGNSETELLAWLKQILNHNLIDTYRRFVHTDKRRIACEQPLPDGSFDDGLRKQTPQTASVLFGNNEKLQQLNRVLSQLPMDYRQVIDMRNWQLLSFAAIGTEMDRSEEAVRKLWVRAIERLRKELQNDDKSW